LPFGVGARNARARERDALGRVDRRTRETPCLARTRRRGGQRQLDGEIAIEVLVDQRDDETLAQRAGNGYLMGAEFDVLAYAVRRYFGLRSFGKVYGMVF